MVRYGGTLTDARVGLGPCWISGRIAIVNDTFIEVDRSRVERTPGGALLRGAPCEFWAISVPLAAARSVSARRLCSPATLNRVVDMPVMAHTVFPTGPGPRLPRPRQPLRGRLRRRRPLPERAEQGVHDGGTRLAPEQRLRRRAAFWRSASVVLRVTTWPQCVVRVDPNAAVGDQPTPIRGGCQRVLSYTVTR